MFIMQTNGSNITSWKQIARVIDHSMLKPDASLEDIKQVCEETIKYGFASLAVNPSVIPYCRKYLEGSDVVIDSSIGFPFGQNTIDTKVFEVRNALSNGAKEIDYVINIVELKAGYLKNVKEEMLRIKEAAGDFVVKAIIETCYLTQDEKKQMAELCVESGLDFIKTSTGFSPGGATKEDVSLLNSIACGQVGVKAAGGMTSLDKVLTMLEAGATRIGTKYSVKI